MLNVTEDTQEAVNSSEVVGYNLYELYFGNSVPSFISTQSWKIGQIVRQGVTYYTAIADNPSPSKAPDGSESGAYWSVTQHPLCLTDWSDTVVYQGKVYSPGAVKLGSISTGSDGRLGDVSLTVGIGHDDSMPMKLVEDFALVGQSVVIHTIIEGASDRPSMTFKIKSAKPSKGKIDFTLSLGFGYFLAQIPGRTIYQNICRHMFRGTRCKYHGGLTTCEHTFEDCKERSNTVNFGGFPGVVKGYFYF